VPIFPDTDDYAGRQDKKARALACGLPAECPELDSGFTLGANLLDAVLATDDSNGSGVRQKNCGFSVQPERSA
jgi:hypothetical protein